MATGFDFNAHTGAREKSLGPCEAEFGAETLHKPGNLKELHPQKRDWKN